MKTTQEEHQTSEIAQEYLETIYNLEMEGEKVVGIRLAEKFGVAPPSVTGMLHRLERDGFVNLDRRRGASLTPAGVASAEASLRKHRLAERFLVEVLGLDWIAAHEEAQALQTGMTKRIEARMVSMLKNPTTCPHGNPIPGSGPSPAEYLREQHAMRLGDVTSGREVRVVLVSEVVEDETQLLQEVGALRLRPGRELTVSQQSSAATIIDVDGTESSVAPELASKIWVAEPSAAIS